MKTSMKEYILLPIVGIFISLIALLEFPFTTNTAYSTFFEISFSLVGLIGYILILGCFILHSINVNKKTAFPDTALSLSIMGIIISLWIVYKISVTKENLSNILTPTYFINSSFPILIISTLTLIEIAIISFVAVRKEGYFHWTDSVLISMILSTTLVLINDPTLFK